ncbi:MAG: hypothetical protein U0165_03135 [Polyangiaceae bacterium]
MTDDPTRNSPLPVAEEPEGVDEPSTFKDEPLGDDFDPDADSGAFQVRSLLKKNDSVPPPRSDVLQGVQHRLRARSRGRFFGDGWSTREDNPRTTYLLTALMMLLLVGLTYVALLPGGLSAP